ncbi:MAG: MotA/TolQ/ExbB proton channel family protein [Gemmataceae bacterium]
MSASHATLSRYRRGGSTAVAALTLGIPLGAGLLYLVFHGPWQEPLLQRYLSHPVEMAELILFCCALCAFAFKFGQSVRERIALRLGMLPPWDGTVVPVDDADKLLDKLDTLPARLKRTWLAGRFAAILDYLRSRGSADELDDQMRSLSDNDAMALDGSYSLTRFITWAIPILGFLGTVVGITQAIAGVTPEKLEKDLSAVTDGLATAFDTTATALALTMVVMFVGFIIERIEQGILDAVDRHVEHELGHRFERLGTDTSEVAGIVRHSSQALLKAVEQTVLKQADIWAKTFAEVESRRLEMENAMQERIKSTFSAAIATALERTAESHARRLAEAEGLQAAARTKVLETMASLEKSLRESIQEQKVGLAPLAKGLGEHTQAIVQLQEGARALVNLQEALNQNMMRLVGTLQGVEWRISAPEFRIRLEPGTTEPASKNRAA